MSMEIAVLFAIMFVAIGVASVFAGADSRIDDVERRRHYLG